MLHRPCSLLDVQGSSQRISPVLRSDISFDLNGRTQQIVRLPEARELTGLHIHGQELYAMDWKDVRVLRIL